jgi:DNA-binding response OmpR family regulator
METRKLILQRAGHTVLTAFDGRELANACQQHSFDVAVIGQGVPGKTKKAFASIIRRHCPSARILELYAPHLGRSLDDADSWLQVPAEVPEELVTHVNELVQASGRHGADSS